MTTFTVYPVFLKLRGEPALVVGGGVVGLRKVRGLVECGARVVVVSREFEAGLLGLKGVERVRGAYAGKYMTREKWRLVFAATDVTAVNERVAADARAAGIWCCRCDDGEAGDFVGGAAARLGKTGAVTVAVNTGGASPGVAGIMLASAKKAIDPGLIQWAELMGRWRRQVKTRVAAGVVRAELLRALGGVEMEATLARGGAAAAEQLFKRWLRDAERGRAPEAAAVAKKRKPAKRESGAVRHGG